MAGIDLFFKNPKTNLHSIEITDRGTFNYVGHVDPEPYKTIESLFGLNHGDLTVVIRAGPIIKRDYLRACHSIEWLQESNCSSINSVIFFIEDLCHDSSRLEFIKKVCKKFKFLNARVFHCEKDYCFESFGFNVRYFDWYVSDIARNIYQTPEAIDLNFSTKICCLNRRFGQHRYLASAFLSTWTDVKVTQQYGLPSVPRGSINIDQLSHTVKLLIQQGSDILHKEKQLKDVTLPVENIDAFDYISPDAILELNQITRQSFCSLVTESRYDSSMPNFSEKTLRVIYSGRPFILLAPAGTLKLLQDLGFKTFSDFWDESYDSQQDHTRRFLQAMESVTSILKKENLDLSPLQSILEHNQKQIQVIPNSMFNLR